MADNVFDKTAEIIAAKADIDVSTINRDTLLETLEIQSLELAEVIFDLEDAFDIEVEMNAADAWDKLKSVGDVVDAVQSLTKSA